MTIISHEAVLYSYLYAIIYMYLYVVIYVQPIFITDTEIS